MYDLSLVCFTAQLDYLYILFYLNLTSKLFCSSFNLNHCINVIRRASPSSIFTFQLCWLHYKLLFLTLFMRRVAAWLAFVDLLGTNAQKRSLDGRSCFPWATLPACYWRSCIAYWSDCLCLFNHITINVSVGGLTVFSDDEGRVHKLMKISETK